MRALLLFFYLSTFFAFCQEDIKQKSIFISIGKPWHPDMTSNLKNVSLSLNYQNRFAESFAYELSYTYSQSNSFPKFFNNSQQLNDYLLSQNGFDIVFNSQWSDVFTHSFGLKMHYAFINNKKWFFSFNIAGGYFFTKSSSHEIDDFFYNSQSGEIINYENSIDKGKTSDVFYSPGIQLNYTLPKNFIIGLDFIYYRVNIKDSIYSTFPVIPDYYNIAIIFGKKF